MKYLVEAGQFRAAGLGGYGQNNGSNGAYQIQAGADVPSQQARMQAAAARRFAELVIGFSISRLPWTAGP